MSDEAIVQAVAERLSLALRATAARYRQCAPQIDAVLDRVGEYLADPEKAERQIERESAALRSMRRIR